MHTNLSDEVKQHYLKIKFRCVLNSSKNNQQLTDQLYNQLCGYTDGNPKIKNIRGDADTLLAIADYMRTLIAPTPKSAAKEAKLDNDEKGKSKK